LRAEPNLSAEILAVLPVDTVVILLDGVEAFDSLVWQEVLVEGQTGWLSAEFLVVP
jgi:hypothetical protein